MSAIKHITDAKELEVGREYYVLQRGLGWFFIGSCRKTPDGIPYFQEHFWDHPDNTSILQRRDVFGPLPSPETDEHKLMKSFCPTEQTFEVLRQSPLSISELVNTKWEKYD